MANLFSHKLLQENIKNVTIPEMEEKIAVLQSWVNAITTQSIYKKTESECEQAFNLDIFHKVLGYSFYPTEHYTLEAKGGNEISGQKADATLGYFNSSDIEKNVSLVQVAVEIKDANTSLTKSQRREGNLSPIQQGFKYKPQYNNCKWVIVTNFVEIRLFKDTQLDYELWNLVDLVNPENEFQNFKLFWYLLNAKHLIAYTNESKTEQLLSEVKEKTEQITKKFYQQYKLLRLELINDIRKNNSKISLDTVVQKSQKIIDRMVFAFFCEDNDLLPQGKIRNYIEKARSMDFTPRELLKKVFKGIDSGSEMLDIPKPGYNGGLFHPDALLDSLHVSDEICQKFINLGEYDFKEELSVNILGHIFEQSISDLEEIRIDLLGTKLKTNELGESTKSNKRKKDGIFYTPEYIVDYIVKNSLGKYLEEQFESIEKKHLKNEKQMSDKLYQAKQKLIYGEYKQVLENITVLDPACGSGAFLVNVFDYLMAEHKRVGEALGMGSLFDNESTYKSILQRNIYGVDLNAESVEITKLSLWLKTAEKGKKLADLDNNIKCGNSLIDDPAVAGEKAFDWHKEFTEIMSKGGFDVIVGNPPYVRQELLGEVNKRFYQIKFPEVYNGIADLYVYFYALGISLLKQNGCLGFITPNKWLERAYGNQLRRFLISLDINIIVNLSKFSVFEQAVADPMIITIKKSRLSKTIGYIVPISANDIILSSQKIKKYTKSMLSKEIRRFSPKEVDIIIEKIKSVSDTTLNNYTNKGIYYGIKTAFNKGFIIDETTYQSLLKKDSKVKNIIKKLLEGDDFNKRDSNHSGRYLINTGYDIDIPHEYPVIYEWLSSFLPEIANRTDKGKNWWNLRACDYYEKFLEPKILYYHTAVYHKFYYDTEGHFISANCYMICSADRYLQCYLNSSLFNFLKPYLFPHFGDVENSRGVRLDGNKMYELPIKTISDKDKKKYSEVAEKISVLSKNVQEKIDFTLRFFQSKFAIEKLSTKLQKFRELDFAGFLKEIKAKKLPLDKEAELMRYFEKEKAEIVTLKTQIDAVDREIDDMVFDLYGLSEEERRVILGG